MNNISIGIVGGGVAGLIALQECLRYPGVDATLYEQGDCLGGLWAGRTEFPGVQDYTQLNTSAIPSSFEAPITFYDFMQTKKNGKNFASASEFKEFISVWVQMAKFMDHIKLRFKVTKVKGDSDGTGNCFIEGYQNSIHSPEEAPAFLKIRHDFVFMCIGHLNTPAYPDWAMPYLPANPGHKAVLSDSDKKWSHLVHSQTAGSLTSTSLLVVGGGSSAGEAVAEALKCGTDRVYWQVIRPNNPTRCSWLIDRYGGKPAGSRRPVDENITYLLTFVPSIVVRFVQRSFFHLLHSGQMSGVLPLPLIDRDNFTVTEMAVILPAINSGRLRILHSSIESISPHNQETSGTGYWSVKLSESDSSTLYVDQIVCATGYLPDLGLLDAPSEESAVKSSLQHPLVFMKTVAVERHNWRLAFLGDFRLLNSIFPVMQLSSRWVLHNWIHNRWTSEKERLKLYQLAEKQKLPKISQPVELCELMASQMGHRPRIWSRVFNPLSYDERALGLALLLGPWSCVRYALDRPSNWIGRPLSDRSWAACITEQTEISWGINRFKTICIFWSVGLCFSVYRLTVYLINRLAV